MFSTVPDAPVTVKDGTAEQFCPKSTTSISPGASATGCPAAWRRTTFARPHAASLAPSTPFVT